jgi:hypothetical protein
MLTLNRNLKKINLSGIVKYLYEIVGLLCDYYSIGNKFNELDAAQLIEAFEVII